MDSLYNNLEIYTIGHGNATVEEVVCLLQNHRVAEVVDVRSVPYSQYTPQFNREQIASVLERSGIKYVFAGEYLGGRPKDPTCYRSGRHTPDNAPNPKDLDYYAVSERPWYQRGIARLLQIAKERRTAILCSEEDPNHCHRHHLITQTLLERGAIVRHIRRYGGCDEARLEARQPALF